MMKRFTIILLTFLVVQVSCKNPPNNTPNTPSNNDEAEMDKSVNPGDDFFAYANGGWLKSTEIPQDKSRYGIFEMLVDESRKRTASLIQESASAGANATPEARRVGDFYSSYMDEAAIESAGVSGIKPQLDEIAKIHDKRDLARAIGGALRADVDPLNSTNFQTGNLFGVWISQGLADPTHSVPYLL